MKKKDRLLKKLKLNLTAFGLTPEAKIVAAVSGGLDSMVLLDMLVAAGYTPVVAHVNYGLRGQDSDLDELLVTQYARARSLVLEVLRPSLKDYCCTHDYSIQEGARILRYDWLKTLCTVHLAQAYAIAHHQEDAAETILLKLVKAHEPFVLHLLKPQDGLLVRPLHDFSREELRIWQEFRRLEYRDDQSNFSDDYQRNLVRNKVLPVLRQLNPNVARLLVQKSATYTTQYAAINFLYKKMTAMYIKKNNKQIYVHIENLYKENPIKIADYFIVHFCQLNSLPEVIIKKLTNQSDENKAQITIRYNKFILQFDNGVLSISVASNNSESVPAGEQYDISINKPVVLGSITLLPVQIAELGSLLSSADTLAYFDADAVQGRVSYRKAKPGESYHPLGFEGSKQVRDILRAGRIPIVERPSIRVLADEVGIIWCPAGRIAQRVAVTQDTCRVVVITRTKLSLT